ncbi:GNAT family N-acetyltransferase [Candidatus Daviesbacteria bacterium]|nr:GNAT family N-acetyltransferase [Candidatus Daviesbacteria bacterium]
MKNIKIRKAVLSDLKIIQDLSQELFEHGAQWDRYFNMSWSHGQDGEKFFRKVLTAKNRICFIADIDGMVVGYLAASVLPIHSWRPVKRTEITNLFVKEKFRGMKIGTKLLESFLKWSKEKGVKRAVVVANANNAKAIIFYKKNRFLPEFVTLEGDIF